MSRKVGLKELSQSITFLLALGPLGTRHYHILVIYWLPSSHREHLKYLSLKIES